MKSMQKSIKRKNYVDWRKLSLEERVRRAYKKLPKTLKELETPEDKEATIQSVIGLFETDLAKGKKVRPYTVLYKNLKDRAPDINTRRKIFTAFRLNETQVFHKYNSYMFRLGLRSTQYFMQNAEVEKKTGDDSEDVRFIATLKLPLGKKEKYDKLEITVHIGASGTGLFEDAPTNAEMYKNRLTQN